MNIASTAAVQSATSDTQGSASDGLNIRVLKKALDMQAVAAQALIESIPQPAAAPALAISGSLGTQLNAYA